MADSIDLDQTALSALFAPIYLSQNRAFSWLCPNFLKQKRLTLIRLILKHYSLS